ncbi:MAG TPA: RNA polymerase sigma factor [Bryobacteraceae bacterium]|nr:RNA polymerase sigma factor [Bryobacteraceae bacterium]
MFRDATYNDVTRTEAIQEAAAFVMDEETFRAFYDRTSRGVWAYLARITGDRQLADDLLQETYYRFLRASAAYETEAHRRNSLFRIATNVARDVRRRQLLRPMAAVAGDEIERVAGGDQAGAAERHTDFERAMSRLKPRERAMLWLAYAEGASHHEIAETLGLRTSSLKVLLFRARRKLASLLRHTAAPRGKEANDAAL